MEFLMGTRQNLCYTAIMMGIMSNDDLDENPDRFPSAGDVESVLRGHLQGIPYKVVTSKSDDKGVVTFEIEINVGGEKTEYNYQRAKYDHTQVSLPSGAKFSASIHSVHYDSDGISIGGQCVMNFRDGKWYSVS